MTDNQARKGGGEMAMRTPDYQVTGEGRTTVFLLMDWNNLLKMANLIQDWLAKQSLYR